MKFQDWMLDTGLSASSALKYASAISGPLTKWASENHLAATPLDNITNHSHFKAISNEIQQLPVFIEHNVRGHQMYSSALVKFEEYLSRRFVDVIEADIEAIVTNPKIGATEKINLVKARIGQGDFRQKLIELWGTCSVTGLKDVNMLIASHIKPWRLSSDEERLDKFNGLLLIPNLDRAFDSGLITFNADGSIRISPQLEESESLGITPDLRIALKPNNEKFMKFHRAEIYRAD